MLTCVDEDAALFESVLSALFGCIQLANAINEKITAAAINALADLPITLWQHLSGRCDSIGRGLATCFGYLHEVSVAKLTCVLLLLMCQRASHNCHLHQGSPCKVNTSSLALDKHY